MNWNQSFFYPVLVISSKYIYISCHNEDHIHKVRFSDVYGNTDEQYKALQVFKKILRSRKVYLNVEFPSG